MFPEATILELLNTVNSRFGEASADFPEILLEADTAIVRLMKLARSLEAEKELLVQITPGSAHG